MMESKAFLSIYASDGKVTVTLDKKNWAWLSLGVNKEGRWSLEMAQAFSSF